MWCGGLLRAKHLSVASYCYYQLNRPSHLIVPSLSFLPFVHLSLSLLHCCSLHFLQYMPSVCPPTNPSIHYLPVMNLVHHKLFTFSQFLTDLLKSFYPPIIHLSTHQSHHSFPLSRSCPLIYYMFSSTPSARRAPAVLATGSLLSS